MTTKLVVADEDLGQLSRRLWDFQRRVMEGSIPLDYALRGTQWIIEQRSLAFTQLQVLQLPETFSPAEFFGDSDWKIWKGDAKGKGLEGAEEIYEPANLTNLRAEDMVFDHFLTDKDSSYIRGEVKIVRARDSKKIVLGGRSFLALWNDWLANKENSVLEWLRKNKGVTWMDFPGLILRDPCGHRYVLYLYFSGESWDWDYDWLDDDWYRHDPSAVLEQVS